MHTMADLVRRRAHVVRVLVISVLAAGLLGACGSDSKLAPTSSASVHSMDSLADIAPGADVVFSGTITTVGEVRDIEDLETDLENQRLHNEEPTPPLFAYQDVTVSVTDVLAVRKGSNADKDLRSPGLRMAFSVISPRATGTNSANYDYRLVSQVPPSGSSGIFFATSRRDIADVDGIEIVAFASWDGSNNAVHFEPGLTGKLRSSRHNLAEVMQVSSEQFAAARSKSQ